MTLMQQGKFLATMTLRYQWKVFGWNDAGAAGEIYCWIDAGVAGELSCSFNGFNVHEEHTSLEKRDLKLHMHLHHHWALPGVDPAA